MIGVPLLFLFSLFSFGAVVLGYRGCDVATKGEGWLRWRIYICMVLSLWSLALGHDV